MLRIKPPRSSVTAVPAGISETTLIREANEFLAHNEFSRAYPLVVKLAESRPESSSLQVTAGLVALQLDARRNAAEHFRAALKVAPDDFDARYNMALFEMTNGDGAQALVHLKHLRRLQPDNARLLNDIAVVWSGVCNYGRALGAYARALRLDPNDSDTRNNAMQLCLERRFIKSGRKLLLRQEKSDHLTKRSRAEIHRWKEIFAQVQQQVAAEPEHREESAIGSHVDPVHKTFKIAVFATHRTFITSIIEALKRDHEVRLFDGDTVDQMRELMTWADVAWFEWCDNLVIAATRLPKVCRIVCRLHSYEAFTDMPSQVDWTKVDRLIFVNRSVEEIFRRQVTAPVATTVIYNGVDLERYSIPVNKKGSKKIASVGYINYKKNPALLLYAFKKIHEYDPEYSLHIAGTHQDPRIQLYFQQFLEHSHLPIHFDGWVEDMPGWYADKGYVISTSLFESFHYSVAEGMACGLIPLIHNWYGAAYLYPERYLYNDPDDCLELLRRLETADQGRLRRENREYIRRRYDQAERMADITSLLEKTAAQDLTKGQ